MRCNTRKIKYNRIYKKWKCYEAKLKKSEETDDKNNNAELR